jgi:hypothetical protein
VFVSLRRSLHVVSLTAVRLPDVAELLRGAVASLRSRPDLQWKDMRGWVPGVSDQHS